MSDLYETAREYMSDNFKHSCDFLVLEFAASYLQKKNDKKTMYNELNGIFDKKTTGCIIQLVLAVKNKGDVFPCLKGHLEALKHACDKHDVKL